MGNRLREYQSGISGGNDPRDILDFKIEGLEETIAIFEQIRDQAMRDKKTVQVIRRVVNRHYVPILKGLAMTMGPKVRGNKFSASMGLLESINKPYINKRTKAVTVRAGARVHSRFRGRSFFPQTKKSGSGRNNYGGGGWLAGFYEYGTSSRAKKSGARTGRIEGTKFASLAHKRAKHITERMLVEKLKNMMEKEFLFASRGMIKPIPKA